MFKCVRDPLDNAGSHAVMPMFIMAVHAMVYSMLHGRDDTT
jgi:hypothetical protein